jgi:integrase
MARECPNCHSKRNWKDGIRESGFGSIQRFICRDCGFRFSTNTKTLNLDLNNNGFSQLCAQLEAKKLEPQTETKTVAGDKNVIKADSESKILEHKWYMKKQGYKEQTIISRGIRLRRLVALGADLGNPESVKETIGNQQYWKDSMKQTVVFAYDLYAKQQKLTWERPRYKAVETQPYMPKEREINDIIAGCGKEIALFVQIGKDTGARAGEIYQLQWKDIDIDSRMVRITPEKGSNPRTLRLSNDSIRLLSSKPRINQQVFTGYKNLNNLRRSYERQRNRQSIKLANPNLREIKLHSLRHWKASTELQKTGNLFHVKEITGHKTLRSLEVYLHKLPHIEGDPEYISGLAKTVPEIQSLVEQGFEYVQSVDGLHIYRKRK